MRAVPPVTLHRASLGNASRIINANLIKLNMPTVGTMLPYHGSVKNFFIALGTAMDLELVIPGLYIREINAALQPVRELMPETPLVPPLAAPLFDGDIPAISETIGVAITPYDASIHFQTGGAVVTYAIMGDANGLVIDAGTGSISGSFILTNNSMFVTVSGTNDAGTAESNTFNIDGTAVPLVPPVFTGPITASTFSILAGTIVPVDYSTYFTGAVTYAIAPAVPGLVFDTATGILTGLPTTVAVAVATTVTATNPDGDTVSDPFNITITA